MIYRLLFISLIIFQSAFSQGRYKEVFQAKGPFEGKVPVLAPLLFRAYPVATAEDEFLLYLITEVQYDFLQFIRMGKEFSAGAQLEVVLNRKPGGELYSRIWEDKFNLPNYSETNSRKNYFLTLDTLRLPAGMYNLRLNYRDLEGKQRYRLGMKLNLSRPDSFYVSPPIFVNPEQPAAPPLGFVHRRPLAIRNHHFFNQPLGIFSRVWAAKYPKIEGHLSIRFRDSEKPLFEKKIALPVSSGYADWYSELPALEWEEGTYRASYIYIAGKDTIKQKLSFELTWFDKPRSFFDLKYAIEPLELITEPDEFKRLSEGDKEAQRRKFESFWKEKDPTPSTAYNEVLDEFYTRVDSMDSRWASHRRWKYGWRTDPGKIYVLYGKPDIIEDQSLHPVHPGMRWIYQFENHRLIFTFRAEEGRKRYRLIDQKEETGP